jgi:hypothetical protein
MPYDAPFDQDLNRTLLRHVKQVLMNAVNAAKTGRVEEDWEAIASALMKNDRAVLVRSVRPRLI